MMVRMLCILALVTVVGGCGGRSGDGLFNSKAPTFDGQRFRSKLSSERKNRQVFTVTVEGVSKSLEGAIAAAEYKATQHCIRYFGTSEIDWTVGPDMTPRVVNDSLTYSGACHDPAA